MKNLVQLLAVLPVAASDDNGGFYKGSTGAGADQVFGLIMCFADTEAINCLDCLSGAPAGITTACPGSGNAKAMYDATRACSGTRPRRYPPPRTSTTWSRNFGSRPSYLTPRTRCGTLGCR